MKKNQKVATQNAEIQELKKQVAELKHQLEAEEWLSKMYKTVLTEGKFEVKNEEEIYLSLYTIGMCCNIFEQATKYAIKDLEKEISSTEILL